MALRKKGWMLIISAGMCLTILLFMTFFYEVNVLFQIFGFLFLLSVFHIGIALVNVDYPIEVRNKRSKYILIITFICIAVGWLFKFNSLLGANVLITESLFLLSLVYAPLMAKKRYDKWKIHTQNKLVSLVLSIGDFLSVLFLVAGLLFKFFHWPGAYAFIFIGITFFLVALFGWNWTFRKAVEARKVAEEKLNAAFIELEYKHQIIEEKQKEIIDSIKYAKRIQQSLMPTEKYIEKSLLKK